ncbi:MAG: stage V sporulation T C-terminal domain-containing protein [Bacillota bacterium]
MRATGIVRKIDNLGRVVIPKEIRQEMKINNGNTLEIFVDRDDSVILKKYSPVEELEKLSDYVATLADTTECDILITDTDKVVASSKNLEQYQQRAIGLGIKDIMKGRNTKIVDEATKADICEDYEGEEEVLGAMLVAPILKQGDVLGAVVLIRADQKLGEYESKVAETTTKILSKQLGL